jgi:hypothetical protein
MSRYDKTLWEELTKHICPLNVNLFLVLRVYHYIYVHIILNFCKKKHLLNYGFCLRHIS